MNILVRVMNKPWELPETPWKTESAFWSWVRGQLRKGWSRHPVKHLYLKQNRYKAEGKRGKMVWHLDCELCDAPTPQSNIEIDHIVPSGSLTCEEDLGPFAARLYMVTFQTIRAVCKDCHGIQTHADKKGLTFFQAKVDKKVIECMKLPSAKLKKVMEDFGQEYQTPKEANREILTKILTVLEAGVYQ